MIGLGSDKNVNIRNVQNRNVQIMIMTKMKMFKILPKIRLEDRFPVYPAEFIGAGNYEEELVLFSFTNPYD